MLKLQQHYHYLVEQIKDLESQLKRKLDEDEVGQRLLSIPCVGTLTASTISTEIGDGSSTPAAVTLRRQQGLYPTVQHGGRTTLLGISKRGNKKIRTLLVHVPGIHTKLEHQSGKLADWVRDLQPEKQLCRHLCSGKQAGQNSPGPNGTTANLCSITAEIHRFKELLIWFCEY
ncbi:IS110 family transposase [Klebsiella pneumoniae]|uniref:IS110 family transposase n=1 Tax=Klebsiella pneumoniae TaxID=573 RepID=A0A939SUU2_KLEPN|nr:IS110 family transposase [Klebsiella pneumoniae]